METLDLSAQKRDVFGKKLKTFRKQGLIPAVLYGHKVKSQHLFVKKQDFDKIFVRSGTSALVDLKIGDEKPQKVLIHEPQRNPLDLKPLHIDFYQVKMTEKIQTEIPLKIIGESPAVKELEGTLITPRDAIEIQCLPSDLIHEIEVDISLLKTFDDSIKISDLKIPLTIEVLDEPEEVLVSVTPPRSEEELAELEAPVEEKVEEVEGVEKKEGEEEEMAEEAPAEKVPTEGRDSDQDVGKKPSKEPAKIPETGQEIPAEKSEEK